MCPTFSLVASPKELAVVKRGSACLAAVPPGERAMLDLIQVQCCADHQQSTLPLREDLRKRHP